MAHRFKLVSGKPNIRGFLATAGQVWAAGDLVYLYDGALKIVDTTGSGISAASLLGVVQETTASAVARYYPVSVITPEQIWRAFPTSTVTPSTDLEQGVDYTIEQTDTLLGEMTSTEGANAVFVGEILTVLSDGDAAGDPILIRFDAAVCQAIQGSAVV